MKIHDIIINHSGDDTTWESVDPNDAWALDKLVLGKKLGYNCGPAGVNVPESGEYIVRPCVNAMGLGLGARKEFLEKDTSHIKPGHFWCEMFDGRHLSVDYSFGKQVLCVEGFKSPDTFSKWDRWVKTEDEVPLPKNIYEHFGNKQYLNCEYIDNKLIEVHFRHNPDFEHGVNEFVPVWEEQDITAPDGYRYKEYPDIHGRIGAFIR